MSDDEVFSNIRDILGELIGKRLVDITQHDDAEEDSFVELMFEDGLYLKFPVPDDYGFHHNCGEEEGE